MTAAELLIAALKSATPEQLAELRALLKSDGEGLGGGVQTFRPAPLGPIPGAFRVVLLSAPWTYTTGTGA